MDRKKLFNIVFITEIILAATIVYFWFSQSKIYTPVSHTPDSVTSGEYREGEFLLGKKLEGERIFHSEGSAIKISPDGRRYWNIVFNKQDERIGVREFIDGKEKRSYTISSGYPMDPHRSDVVVSFKSNQSAYIVLSGKPSGNNEWYVITNGVENGPYAGIGKLTLTPDDKIAYVAYESYATANRPYISYLIVDGKKIDLKGIIDFQYSYDGRRLAYVFIDTNKKYHLILDEREIAIYGHMEKLTFSPDGKKLAYIARNEDITRPGESFVVVNDTKQKPYKFIRNLTFSPDGSKLVYSASDGPHVNPEKSVLNGMEGQEYLWIFRYVFSPDNSKLAYSAEKKLAGVKNESYVVLNDRVVGIYPGEEHGEESGYSYIRNFVGDLVFSPDSKHLAYTVSQSRATNSILNPYEGSEFMVVDGRQKEISYDDVFNVAFTPDGKYIRYNAVRGEDILLVVEKIGEK